MPRFLVRSCLAICLSGFCLLGLQAADADKDALRYDGKPFAYWETYMRTELKSERRIEGLRALAAFGVRGHAEEAAKAIVEVVKDYGEDAYGGDAEHATPDQRVILEAKGAIFKIGPAAYEVVLRNAKNDRLRMFAHGFVPYYSYEGMNRYEIVLSATAVTILLDYLQGEQVDAREFAVETLGRVLNRQWQTKEITQKILREKKDTEALAHRLTALLEKKSSSDIVEILKAMGPSAKPAAKVLVKARLRGDFNDDAVFTAIGVETVSLLPAIQEGLKSDDAVIRLRAASWIGSVGIKAKAALPALLQEVKDGPKKESKAEKKSSAPVGLSLSSGSKNEEDAWLAALDAAIAVGADRPQLVPSTIRVVGDRTRTYDCRSTVVKRLTEFGKQAKEAVPILVARFSDDHEDARIRTEALTALEAIGFENRQVVPSLVKVIEGEMEENPTYNHCSSDVPIAALYALAKLQPQSRESMQTLIRAFAQYTYDWRLRAAIAPALGAMGPAAREALPALREATKEDENFLRKAAKAAIEKIDK